MQNIFSVVSSLNDKSVSSSVTKEKVRGQHFAQMMSGQERPFLVRRVLTRVN